MAVSIVSEIEATKIQSWNTKTKSSTNEDEFYNSYKNYFIKQVFYNPSNPIGKKTNSFINFKKNNNA
jgi:hypothetical protein